MSVTVPVNVMLIPNIPEEPDLALGHEHGHAQGMDGRIAKSFIVEASASVQPIEILLVRFAPKEFKAANLEVGEELTIVIVTTVARVEQPVEVGVGMNEFRMGVDERARAGPERGKGARVIKDIHVEAILHVVVAHEAEDVVVDVTEIMDLWNVYQSDSPIGQRRRKSCRTYVRFNAPIPVKVSQSRMLVEETAVPSTHVPVADHPSFTHANSTKVLKTVHESAFVDPIRQRPVLGRDNFIVALSGSEILCCCLSNRQTLFMHCVWEGGREAP